jgi:hypothetical protein
MPPSAAEQTVLTPSSRTPSSRAKGLGEEGYNSLLLLLQTSAELLESCNVTLSLVNLLLQDSRTRQVVVDVIIKQVEIKIVINPAVPKNMMPPQEPTSALGGLLLGNYMFRPNIIYYPYEISYRIFSDYASRPRV